MLVFISRKDILYTALTLGVTSKYQCRTTDEIVSSGSRHTHPPLRRNLTWHWFSPININNFINYLKVIFVYSTVFSILLAYPCGLHHYSYFFQELQFHMLDVYVHLYLWTKIDVLPDETGSEPTHPQTKLFRLWYDIDVLMLPLTWCHFNIYM